MWKIKRTRVAVLGMLASLLISGCAPQTVRRHGPEPVFQPPAMAAAMSVPRDASTHAAAAVRVFFGNLHSHTSYSDGSGTPSGAYGYARDVGHLDFLAITEHNHRKADGTGERKDGLLIATKPQLYNGPGEESLISAARRYTQDGKFVALYGQEFSTISAGNHVNVFEIGEVIDDTAVPNGDFAKLIQWLSTRKDSENQDAIVQFNHPSLGKDPAKQYGRDDFPGEAAWVKAWRPHVRTVEVLNGPALKKGKGLEPTDLSERYYLEYLQAGHHLAPTADQDNHYRTWGTITDARTGVIAAALTKHDILNAIRQRHVYATTDKNLRVVVWVNGHLCGDRLSAPGAAGTKLDVKLAICDDDEPQAQYRVQVWSGKVGGARAEMMDEQEVEGDTPVVTIHDVEYTGAKQYIFFKLFQREEGEDAEDDTVWTAPVWFDAGEVEPAVVVAPADGGVAIASRHSKIYHTSADCPAAKRISPQNRVTGAEAKEGRREHIPCGPALQ